MISMSSKPARVREAIEALPWRSALPADGMPLHQYVILGQCPPDAWDVLAAAIREHPESYDAYFRGYPWPMHYWEFESHRYWRTSAAGATHMLNRCTLDNVEPPRRVDDGATPAEAWSGPPWALDGTPWPPGYVPGPGPRHYRGMRYDPSQDPRRDHPCRACDARYWLYEPSRPCPRCGEVPVPTR
jgi:hypothetical protein